MMDALDGAGDDARFHGESRGGGLCATHGADDLLAALPGYALRVVRVLEGAGHEAWVVGGWVRDALQGKPGHDVDVTTSAPWQDTARVLRAAGIEVHETGTAHGTVTAVVDGLPVETTTYRVESGYSDLRHPDEVRFVTDVREDLARRDFTVNAMAYHPERGLLDPFGGREDLERGVIRAVGDPRRRFGEDALRVLRAVRFACRMGFQIEAKTQEALVECAPELAFIAQERIGQELDGILASGRVAWALMNETDVMLAAIPELAPARGFDQKSPYHAYDVLEHIARVCAAVEEFEGGVAARTLRWAALLHDVAKPACWSEDESGRGHFFCHPEEGARVTREVMGRMGLPREVVRGASTLVLLHDYELTATPRSMRRMLAELDRGCPGMAEPLAFQLLDLKRADAVAKAPSCMDYAIELDDMTRALREELGRGACYRTRDLAVTGADVIRERGMEPGPGVGVVLAGLLAAVLADELPNDREVLLEEIRW